MDFDRLLYVFRHLLKVTTQHKEFEAAMRRWEGRNVIVIGHGWMATADEQFIWQGDVDEFLEMWQVD